VCASPAENGLLIAADISRERIAVLASGGIESAILTALLSDHFEQVQPIYVQFGLHWETAEEAHFRNYLAAIANDKLLPLKTLQQPVQDLYGSHWSVSGRDVPDSSTPDEAVFLPGRNLLLLVKTLIWCASNNIPTIAMGHLQTNPFPDATSEFFAATAQAASLAMESPLKVVRPFGIMHKHQVLQLGRDLPLHLSFSCIAPVERHTGTFVHCGRCNKCAERQNAFSRLSLDDRTIYATTPIAAAPA
jgi:7-cyano-7-deazaguanine synthase